MKQDASEGSSFCGMLKVTFLSSDTEPVEDVFKVNMIHTFEN